MAGKFVELVHNAIFSPIFNKWLHMLVSNQIENNSADNSQVDLMVFFIQGINCSLLRTPVIEKSGIASNILSSALFITALEQGYTKVINKRLPIRIERIKHIEDIFGIALSIFL